MNGSAAPILDHLSALSDPTRARLQAVIDRFLAGTSDGALVEYARAARAGELI